MSYTKNKTIINNIFISAGVAIFPSTNRRIIKTYFRIYFSKSQGQESLMIKKLCTFHILVIKSINILYK